MKLPRLGELPVSTDRRVEATQVGQSRSVGQSVEHLRTKIVINEKKLFYTALLNTALCLAIFVVSPKIASFANAKQIRIASFS